MALTIHEPIFFGLVKVISGGQCGADRGALEAAYAMNVATGGTAPRGFRTQFGPAPILGSKFGLIEDPSFAYPPRTLQNVRQSNGTLIIASNPDSPGCRLTSKLAKKEGKPLKIVKLDEQYTNDWLIDRAIEVSNWIEQNGVCTLNVAGNRDKFGFFHHHSTEKLITNVLLDLYNRDLLVTDGLESTYE